MPAGIPDISMRKVRRWVGEGVGSGGGDWGGISGRISMAIPKIVEYM